mmetsp:Transcript_30274/g.48929  ORF Transcript_30274/g.48929 Transcript_30274/m.48929 type:complete len:127 (+) Transcript_30274:207-587(+)
MDVCSSCQGTPRLVLGLEVDDSKRVIVVDYSTDNETMKEIPLSDIASRFCQGMHFEAEIWVHGAFISRSKNQIRMSLQLRKFRVIGRDELGAWAGFSSTATTPVKKRTFRDYDDDEEEPNTEQLCA